jgi:uncharacterized protein with HEPN domain
MGLLAIRSPNSASLCGWNAVVHEYFGVTDEILDKTAREDLPTTIEPLLELLSI